MEKLILVFEALSSILLGAIVMYIGFFFIAREKNFTAAEFGGFITAFLGGAILTVYTTHLNQESQWIFWFYPVGLLCGMIAYWALGGAITVAKLP
jgi:hypothetical protein